jgi:predicted TIM-barrel fold metal-dependent hydrolase
VISVENGSGWVRALLKAVDKAAALGRRGPMVGGALPDRPSESLAEHLWVCPFPEDDVVDLVDALGADHVLFGSDYPHPEGMSDPLSFVDDLQGLPQEDVAKVMGGNMNRMMNLAA